MTDEDLEILTFADQRWKYAGAKDAAILEQFGISSTRYYQRLGWIIEQPEAEAVAPQLVGRLRRLRAARAGARRATSPGR